MFNVDDFLSKLRTEGKASPFVRAALGRILPELVADSEDGFTMDVEQTYFLQRELEAVEQRLYREKLRPRKYAQLIPIDFSGPAGAAEIAYYLTSRVGMFKLIANNAKDLPRSDAYTTRNTAKVHQLGGEVGYTTRDLRHSAMSGRPLEAAKIDSAREAYEFKVNELAWLGDAASNMFGLINNPNIAEVQAPLNLGGTSRLWADKTSFEIIDDIATLCSGIRITSKEVHQGDTLILPIAQNELIRKRLMENLATPITIAQYILNNVDAYGIRRIVAVPELVGQGPAAEDVAMLYEYSDENMALRLPLALTMNPPERRSLEFIIAMEAECAGVVVRYPLACRKLYGI